MTSQAKLGIFTTDRDLIVVSWDEWLSAPHSKTLEEVLLGRPGHLGVPILYGLPLGHGPTIATLPLGWRLPSTPTR